EGRVDNAEHRPEDPARVVHGPEDRVVADGEEEPVDEVKGVPDHARAAAVVGEDRPEQERDVHPCEAELLGDPQAAREHDRAHHPACERAPEAHWASSIEWAAFTSARCVRPWGKLPRNSRLFGSISSE